MTGPKRVTGKQLVANRRTPIHSCIRFPFVVGPYLCHAGVFAESWILVLVQKRRFWCVRRTNPFF
jgi:hypothetical protein